MGKNAIIVRLPGILGANSNEFKELKAEYAKCPIEVLINVYMSKNTDLNVAQGIYTIIKNDLKGIFHLTSKDVISYYECTRLLAEKTGLENPIYKQCMYTEDMYYEAL